MNPVRPETPQATARKHYSGVIALAVLSFFSGALTGIWRIALTRGFLLSPIPQWWPPHGLFMVGGFLAAVIMMERMIALHIWWLAWVPYAYVFSGLFLQTGSTAIRLLHLAALAGWVTHRWLAYRAFRKYEKPVVESIAYITLSFALLYPGGLPATPLAAFTALSFPIATIIIERLEMGLNFRRIGAHVLFWLLMLWCILWIACLWLNVIALEWLGLLTFLIAIGTIREDVSLWIKTEAVGIHQFLRNSLATAYIWLLLAGIAMMLWGYLPGAVAKDVVFHLLGLGFIFTMILAHAPLIVPAVFGKVVIPARFPLLPFVAFQLMTAVRIISDMTVSKGIILWMWSGWITGIVHLLSFVVYIASIVRVARRTR